MSDEDNDLDALVRRVDPDRWLASRFIADAARRADVMALYAFDQDTGTLTVTRTGRSYASRSSGSGASRRDHPDGCRRRRGPAC